MKPNDDIDIVEMAYNLLVDIDGFLLQKYGKKYDTKLTKGDGGHTLCTEDFILTFSEESMHFYLSFKVGLLGRIVASLTKDIMLVMTHDEFTIIEDSYYDEVEGKLKFGADALYVRQRDIIADSGKIKCPICEKIYNKSSIHANGICKYCDVESIMWH